MDDDSLIIAVIFFCVLGMSMSRGLWAVKLGWSRCWNRSLKMLWTLVGQSLLMSYTSHSDLEIF